MPVNRNVCAIFGMMVHSFIPRLDKLPALNGPVGAKDHGTDPQIVGVTEMDANRQRRHRNIPQACICVLGPSVEVVQLDRADVPTQWEKRRDWGSARLISNLTQINGDRGPLANALLDSRLARGALGRWYLEWSALKNPHSRSSFAGFPNLQ